MPRLFIALLACAAIAAACDDGGSRPAATPSAQSSSPQPSSARPLPQKVQILDEPQGVGLRDPAFTALPGATAYFGRLGGTVYQIEMPDAWNGRLVLYQHGFQGLAPEASVQQPGIRSYLVRNGFAWAASSYSSTALIPGRAADETAALWDEFAARFGRPDRTYVTGHSMGGAAGHISAERYGDRFDGVLAMCGYAGQTAITRIIGDYLFTGAYVAGVTQEEFDAIPLDRLVAERIRPVLRDEAAHRRWMDLLLDMTGGARAHDRRGFLMEEGTNWERAKILVATGLAYNQGREYVSGGGVTREDLNAGIVRRNPASANTLENFNEGNELTGVLQVPMITMHTTGDWQVPIDQQQILRRTVDAAGKGNLLVQRIVRAPQHCAFLDGEWERGLEDLIAWVENGKKPEGEDVLVADLRDAGKQFTLAPRFGSPEALTVRGAGERVTVRGRATLDGQPLVFAFVWAEVIGDGLRRLCAFPSASLEGGRFEQTLASESEKAGCGAPGRSIRVAASVGGKLYFSGDAVAWPAASNEVTLDVNFTSSDASRASDDVTPVYGTLYDASGLRMPPGTRIEAYIGDVLCGVTGIPEAVMQFENRDVFDLLVAGPDAVPGCHRDGLITFKVDGAAVRQTATNILDGDVALDLTLR